MATDLKQLDEVLKDQFRNLSGVHPGLWPILPRMLLALGVAAVAVAGGYFLYWQSQYEELEAGAQKEVQLRDEFKQKVAQAVNLEELKRQKEQVDKYVVQMEKQLPGKAEMAALLSDINNAGTGRGLTFELFKPNRVDVKDYYAEQPIELRVNGSYHDLGAFAGDLAGMARIVTLNNVSLDVKAKEGGKDLPAGTLQLNAIAKTFRYLDPEEVAEQRKVANEKKKGDKKK
ncbi:type IV pilus assembly protein PilO [Duganella sp. CF458]|uniref:type 4a pilus biogenesis protein PilO n=1 Tax=Duganella sp. CF458 TaxID=1884368 RepID=UPI0008E6CB5A|nr:type 4a pilus biogenesis protein PilO [Duganella sp. CF458]SFG16434.1 type IV pilus assembly protein PilO [Duganella sp. CF458]